MLHPSSVRPFLLFILILACAASVPAKAQWIDGGGFHTCALDAAGNAFCWGADTWGQLGDGTAGGSRTTVAPVTGLPGSLTTISAGDSHSCALTASQGVKCWGWNAYGQLGDGTNQSSAVPVDVQGLASGVSAIAVGGSHTCATLLSGAVKCWGYNSNGQLGDGTTTDRNVPVDVTGLPGVVFGVSAGLLHTCALTQAGGVKCWGENFLGALGDGTRTDRHSPVDVVGLSSGAVGLTAGIGHTCALGSQGLWLKCWGRNEYGQVGDNSYTTPFHTSPVDVANNPGSVAMIAAGGFHTCLLTTGGAVSCWGANEFGQLGNGGTGLGAPAPVQVIANGVTRIGAGFHHSCAISTDGLARCWGRNDNGQLGDGTSGTNRLTPVVVAGFFAGGGTVPTMPPQTVAAGGVVTCALDSSGGLNCWGENVLGALGDGTNVSRTVPGPVSGLPSGVASVSAGSSHACAITLAGGAKCWGDNVYGALGDGNSTMSPVPVDVAGLGSDVAGISAGNSHTCALTVTGGVKCWGSNSYGQLGFATTGDRQLSPGDVPGLESGSVAVSASKAFHTCALRDTGEVTCWGSNFGGQLGDGSTTDSPSPVAVAGLPAEARAISTGANHSCALTAQGGVYCWGRNDWGQLGDGTSTHSPTPVAVLGLSNGVASIAAGGYHTCALMESGGVQCWGLNELGELGDSAAGYARTTPGYVFGLTSDVAELSAGNRHNCVRMADATLQCWGLNQQGQIGIGNTTNQPTPAGVVSYMGGDIVPDVFAFTPATGVTPGGIATSGPVTITGMTMPAIVSVTGGQYSVGCTATYTADAGIVLAGQSVCVRHTASSAPNTTTTTTLTVSTVSASFTSTTSGGVVLQEYLLTVTKSGTGSGTVTSNPVGISCGADCDQLYGDATVVSLTATADAGSVFAGWGGACTGTGACSFTMSQTRTVTASFTSNPAGVAQYITFGQQLDRAVGSPPFNLFAFASSGLPVTFSSQTPGVCTVSGDTVTIVAAGTCTIASDQGGNATYGVAPQVVRSLSVAATVEPSDVKAIAAGYFHTCAVTTDGGVKCWGDNFYGQLGDGTKTNRSAPVDVSGLTSGVVAVAAGEFHTCALTTAGGVKCWGANYWGQLGDGTLTERLAPVDVSGLTSGAVAVIAGFHHNCALTAAGAVKCWGNNGQVQLGDGTNTDRLTPVDVIGLASGAVAVAAGNTHTCALTTAGGVKCWGFNVFGQLGDGTQTDRSTPVDVSGLTGGVVSVAAGNTHTCAVTTAGAVKCWGGNPFGGQLGDGTQADRLTPVDVIGLTSGVVAVTGGSNHTCAVTTTGAVKCWGGNIIGQLGDGTQTDRLTPVDVLGLTSGVVAVAAGAYHTCALTTAGAVKCWGRNYDGQLGDSTVTNRAEPVDVVGLFGGDATPDAFSFAAQNGVPVGTVRTSNAVAISGITGPVAVSVSNGSYSIGCGTTFTSDPGVIANGQAVCVKHTAASSMLTSTTTTLTIGGMSGSFTSTTTGFTLQEYLLTVTKSGTGSGTVTSNPVGISCGADCDQLYGDATVVSLTATADAGSAFAGWSGACTGTGACSVTMSQARTVTASFTLADTTPDPFTFGTKSGVTPGATVTSKVETITGINAPAPVTVANGLYAINCQEPYVSTPGTITNGQTVCVQHVAAPTALTSRTTALTIGGERGTFTSTTSGTAQTITFGQQLDRAVGSPPFNLFAFASSGLPITFSSQTTGVCTVSGNTVSIVAAGTCSIAADQGGNASFGPAPQEVRSLLVASSIEPTDVVSIAMGRLHACALTVGGGVKCWGPNAWGQLGDGTTTSRLVPVDVEGLSSGVVAISAGDNHSCAVVVGGAVKCWGRNDLGQLGDGTLTDRTVPVDVTGLSGVLALAAGDVHTCALVAGGTLKCWGFNGAGQLGDGSLTDRLAPVDVVALGSAVAIAAGGLHTCALTVAGGVKCWGSNLYGQLGNNSTSIYDSLPVDVVGLGSGVAAITAGAGNTCALASGGGMKCWGRNDYGQLGDNTTTDRSLAVDVVGLTGGIVAISAGDSHTCALTDAGGVKCWGSNNFGELATTGGIRLTPVDVQGLPARITGLAAGFSHTCAITAEGGIKCWGLNVAGELGDGTTTGRMTPVDVVGLFGGDATPDAFSFPSQNGVPVGTVRTSNAVAISGIAGPVAVSVSNGSYSIGCGTTFTSDPGVVTNGQTVCVRHVASASSGFSVTTTLTVGGVSGTFTSMTSGVVLFEYPLTVAKSGTGNGTVTSSPVGINCGATCQFPFGDATVVSLTAAADAGSLFAGWSGACTGTGACSVTMSQARSVTATFVLVDTTPDAFTFASKTNVLPGATVTSAPVAITGINSPASVSVANGYYAINCQDPYISNPGTIANGQTICVQHAAAAAPATDQTSTLTVGGVSATFTSTTGRLAQTITFGQLPDRGVGSAPFSVFAFTSSGLPVFLSTQTPSVCTVSGSTVTAVAPGTCSIGADQAGSAAFLPAPQVVRSFAVATVVDPEDITAVTAGDFHTCALTTGGGVKCWGENGLNGQIGDGTLIGRVTPVDVVGLTSGVAAVSAGGSHNCALTTAGGVRCWGNNSTRQLGDGTFDNRSTPVDVSGLASGMAAVSAGHFHTCALTTAGGVKCWGGNYSGQLGDGTQTERSTPLDVTGLASGVVAVTAGREHTCALTVAGGVKCWGSNRYGELGDGTLTRRATPVDVSGLTSGAVAVTARGFHTCALMTSGGIKCWGRNDSGELGDGTLTGRLTPVDVSGLASDVVAVAAGGSFDSSYTCAVTTVGGVKCWGNNGAGQLGDGTTANRSAPVDVSDLTSGAVAVAAGMAHTCALTVAGGVKCWGDNYSGKLGDGTQTNRVSPVDVVGLDGLDRDPEALALGSRAGVQISTVQVSNAVVPVGYFDPAPISVTGGEYSIGCTASFTTVAGIINPGQSVCVRHVAASSYSTAVTTTLTVGGVSGTFTSTTASAPSLAIAPPRLDFAARAVGTTSALQVVTVTNAGGHELTGLGWGANGDFAVIASTCGATLLPGASCTISVVFTPSVAGPRADDLLVFGANANPATITARLTGTGLASDTTPAAFTFTDQYLVAPSTVITSAPVQVTGLTGAATVSVANGSYCVSGTNSCSGCAFRQDPSTISDGQYLCARHTSSPIPGGQVDTLVFVGGLGDAFTSITIDTVPAAFSFPAVSGVQPATVQASSAAAIVGINAPAPVSVTGGEYSVGCTGTWTSTAGTVTNGQTVCVRHVAAGSYSATTSTTLTIGGVTGAFVTTTAPATSIPRLGNISTRMQVLTGNDVLIGGFIIGGSLPKTVVVRARGPSLAPFGITNFLANPMLQLYSGQTPIAANDDWAIATNAAALTASGFAPEIAQESAILITLNPGAYTAIVSGVGGTTGVGIVEVFEVDLPEVPLANISTRGSVLTGYDVMIGGFVIQGDRPQTVIVRARGPSLADFGITNPLANPVLQLFSGQTMIAMNDNWQESAEAGQILSRGFAPASPFESAILITLNPGAYTAIVTGAGGTTGVGIIEVFAQ